jgi:hypothetical protein
MKMNKKAKGGVLQGIKQGQSTEEVFCAYMRESIGEVLWEMMQECLIHKERNLPSSCTRPERRHSHVSSCCCG